MMKRVILMALFVAMSIVPATSQEGYTGAGGVDVLRDGIFESDGDIFQFPQFVDTNYKSLEVGDDDAFAVGWPWNMMSQNGPAVAANDLEIKNNQDTGDCACCQALDANCPCQDCCLKMNAEQIEIGDRTARAFGFATATNNVKVVTNQV
jgi:hypothetical protein